MDAVKSLLVVALVVVVGSQLGSAIKCVECNSKYESFCDDLPGDFNFTMHESNKYNKYLIDCSQKGDNGTVKGLGYNMCRVMKQTVKDDKSRTIRMCAAHGKGGKCYERTGTKDIKLSYCTCEGDWCNTAAGLFSTKIALLTVISAVLALLSHS